MIQESEFRNKISIISVMCSMLVIWIHTNNLEEYGITAQSTSLMDAFVYRFEVIWGGVERIAVPMFFFISGMLFYRNYDYGKIVEKWRSRCKSIVFPYFLWASFYYFFFATISLIPAIAAHMNSYSQYELSLMSWIRSLWVDQYYTLWFLKNLMVFIIISPALYFLLQDRKNIPTGLISYLVLVIAFVAVRKMGVIDVSLFSGIEVFGLGAYIGINHRNAVYYKAGGILSVSALVYLIIHVVLFTDINGILEYVDIAAVWFAVDLVSDRIKVPKWLQITFFVYVAHDILLEAYEKVFLLVFGTSSVAAFVDFLIMPFLVMATLVGMSVVLKKYAPPIWKLVNGFR